MSRSPMTLAFAFRAVLAITLLSGTAIATSAANATSTVTYATGTDARTLDPQYVTDIPTGRAVMQMHETLVGRDKAGGIKGVLAESWTVSEDGKVWTFKLRDGVKFHDGTPFNAEAVKFTFDRIKAKETAAPRASILAPIASVEVGAGNSIVITTKERFAPLLSQLSAYPLAIISPAAGKVLNNEYSRAPSGTGPFKLGKWSPGEKLELVRNDDYWGEKSKADKIEMVVVPEDSTRLLKLMSKEADIIANVSPIMISRLKSSPDIEIVNEVGIRTIYVGFNVKIKPFDNIKVRQAIAHAIDTKSLLEGVMNNVGSLGGSMESPILPSAPVIPPYSFDPALSKKLLAEAGFPNGFETDFFVPTGRYINDRQLGEAIQAQLADVGIKAKLQSPEWGAYQTMLGARDKIGMFLLGKGSPTGDLDYTITTNISKAGSVNYHAYENADIEKLIPMQRGAIDEAERKRLLEEILTKAYNDVPWVVLFYENQIFATRKNVSGFAVLPNELLVLSTTAKAE